MTTPIINQSKSEHGDPKQLYKSLKKRLKLLIYENECFQEELRKCQKELISIKCDEYFLLDKLLQYEDIQSTSSSDSDATDYSESEIDVKPSKPKSSTAKRLKTNNGAIAQNIDSSSTAGPLKRKRAKSKGSMPISSQKSLITYGAPHRNKETRGKKNNEMESTSTIGIDIPLAVTQMKSTTTTSPPLPTSSIVTGTSLTTSSSSSSSSGFLNINSLVPNHTVPISSLGSNSFYIATTPSTTGTQIPAQSPNPCNSSLLMAEAITPSTGPTASLLRPNLKVSTTPSPSIAVTTTNSMLKFSPLIQTTKLPSILSASKSSGLSLSVPLKPSSPGNAKFSTKLLLNKPTSSITTSTTSVSIPVSTSTGTIPFICKTESKTLSQSAKSTLTATLLSESTKTVVATGKPTMSSTINCKTESMPLIRTKLPSILLLTSTAASSSSLPSTSTVAKATNSKTTSTFTLQTESKPAIRTANKTPSILLASKISATSQSLPTLSSYSTTTTLAPTPKASSSSSLSTSTTTTPKSESSLTSGWYLLTQPITSTESPSILSTTQEVSNGGQFTLEEIERHFESRPIQSSLLLPEKTPLTLPSELFSND